MKQSVNGWHQTFDINVLVLINHIDIKILCQLWWSIMDFVSLLYVEVAVFNDIAFKTSKRSFAYLGLWDHPPCRTVYICLETMCLVWRTLLAHFMDSCRHIRITIRSPCESFVLIESLWRFATHGKTGQWSRMSHCDELFFCSYIAAEILVTLPEHYNVGQSVLCWNWFLRTDQQRWKY